MKEKGQGALEYLLLIGGGLIVTAVVVGLTLSVMGSGDEIGKQGGEKTKGILERGLESLGGLTIYEDGEHGTTENWGIYDNDPVGTITNEYDPSKGSRVIKLDNGQATGWSTGYILGDYSVTSDRNPNDEAWHNTNEFNISFSIKCPVSETSWRIYVSTMTDAGHRYITYAEITHTGTDYVPIILTGINDDKWHEISRNLNNELHTEEPGNNILSVEGFLIRGNCSADDIKLKE